MFTGLLANSAVSDSRVAQEWYTKLLGKGPDVAPMPGLLEWHLSKGLGIQVWTEPDRAGGSAVVIEESDVDALANRLTAAGIHHAGPEPGGGQRILQTTDPDGNRIVFTGE